MAIQSTPSPSSIPVKTIQPVMDEVFGCGGIAPVYSEVAGDCGQQDEEQEYVDTCEDEDKSCGAVWD
ncbi:predicted protein [Histoplasma mississippiense (nom. inval.)]|uniref:predicted protein n=1 Tax=Ajellomyces capsulatus (strain NAm1 / WU24) TaxID=2059318 RepID=UPI000157CECD|nr:predicted protein [Histoplasma mississippiense (nom. inval.)]EDN11346.1 predicted protein [Histoplasma mississippiense (nom. inval.)]